MKQLLFIIITFMFVSNIYAEDHAPIHLLWFYQSCHICPKTVRHWGTFSKREDCEKELIKILDDDPRYIMKSMSNRFIKKSVEMSDYDPNNKSKDIGMLSVWQCSGDAKY
jgi:hypothetical protein